MMVMFMAKLIELIQIILQLIQLKEQYIVIKQINLSYLMILAVLIKLM